MKHLTRRTFAATLAGAAALLHHPLWAQSDYPSRTIRLVVPFAPGGGGDVLGRLLGEKLAASMGKQVIVSADRPGFRLRANAGRAVRSRDRSR